MTVEQEQTNSQPTPSKVPFGDWLYAARKRNRLTIVQLSDLSGVSRSYISLIEEGKHRNVSINKVVRLMNALGHELEEVVHEIQF